MEKPPASIRCTRDWTKRIRGLSLTGTLEQRPFGRTGEKVSVIGLGGAALHKHSYQHGLATVKHALDLGISYFDTSPLTVNAVRKAGGWLRDKLDPRLRQIE